MTSAINMDLIRLSAAFFLFLHNNRLDDLIDDSIDDASSNENK